MKRDCAERAVGRIDVDDRLVVHGEGDDATLGIGVTFTPPASGSPVHLADGRRIDAAGAGRPGRHHHRPRPRSRAGKPVRADADLHPEPVRRPRRRRGPHRAASSRSASSRRRSAPRRSTCVSPSRRRPRSSTTSPSAAASARSRTRSTLPEAATVAWQHQHMIRWIAVLGLIVAAALATVLASGPRSGWWFVAAPLIFVALVGSTDLIQRRHSVLRNYPVLGHARFLLEEIRPEIRGSTSWSRTPRAGRTTARPATSSTTGRRATTARSRSAPSATSTPSATSSSPTRCGPSRSPTASSRRSASAARSAPSPTTSPCSTSRR